MVGSVNRVILIGNVGKDPELRNLGNGKSMASFSVATSESWKDKNSGDRKEHTEWHRIAVFQEDLVRFAEHHVKKGMKVYIEGQNQTRKWDKEGQPQYTTEVVLKGFNCRLESVERGSGSGGPPPPESEDDYGTTSTRSQSSSSSAGMDDDIPF